MRIINYLNIIIWYLFNFKFLPNLFFLIKNKIMELIFSEHKKPIYEENLKFSHHNFFFKKECIKSLNFQTEKIYLDSLKKNKKKVKSFGGEADLSLLHSICNKIKSKNIFILETGVALGWSSLVFLFFLSKKKGQLFSIDMPYINQTNFDYVGAAVPDALKNKWQLYRLPDFQGLKKILKKKIKFDLIHYDSDKSYYGRKRSYEILWFLLKKKGYFISDDISDNFAFLDFVRKKKLIKNKNYYILKFKRKYIGIVKK